jgi:hypothetical protein
MISSTRTPSLLRHDEIEPLTPTFTLPPRIDFIDINDETHSVTPYISTTLGSKRHSSPGGRVEMSLATISGVDGPKWYHTAFLPSHLSNYRRRHNREGTKFGNNRVGRRGTPTCEPCRKRKSKVKTRCLTSLIVVHLRDIGGSMRILHVAQLGNLCQTLRA